MVKAEPGARSGSLVTTQEPTEETHKHSHLQCDRAAGSNFAVLIDVKVTLILVAHQIRI